MTTQVQPMRDRRGRAYTPAIGPRLRPLLWVILLSFAVLGANGFYLASVTALTWYRGTTQQTFFYMLMVLLHLVLGFLVIVPFLVFGGVHLATSWKRPNRDAVRYGLALLAAAIVILVSGLVLVRIGGFEVRDPRVREVGYWLHVAAPLVAIGLYVKHRLAGPMIRWHWTRRFGLATLGFVIVMGLLHHSDPLAFGVKGPKEGKKYFYPSEAITATGNFIPADTLMMDDYCMKCHKDAYEGWFHSAHHFSSFNNKPYLFSVRETRKVGLERDKSTQASRWCAGCHDLVPFFSGAFDNPDYDLEKDPTSQAGITCTACHAITNVNNTRGNAAYTIEEPVHYPFAKSKNPILQWINNTLVKAKPEMHKKTFLKPVIKSAEFCSTCHKVGLPYGVNHYKDFVRGQDHYNPFLLSGVSGHGARSFYYPEVAKTNCTECHLEMKPSEDFGAKDFDGKGGRKIHDHFVSGANTGLAAINGDKPAADRLAKFLADKKLRVDIFGLREGGEVDGRLVAPLRPEDPVLKPGGKYLVEVVVRTLNVGHLFSQGTVDSNEIWVELAAKSDGKVIGHSGGIDPKGYVDHYAHFINVYMLNFKGGRVDRRNPQDIFVPLYNKQIPPGAGQVVHFALEVPPGLTGPIELEAKVNYRKFDRIYMDYVFGKGLGPELPIVVMARDAVQLAIDGGKAAKNEPSPIQPAWQRWNDFGIGLFLEGSEKGSQKGELRQAEQVFLKVADLGRADGFVNLARVYQREGRIAEALTALEKAAAHKEPPAPWVITWLTGQINVRNAMFDQAIENFQQVLDTRIPERKIDLSLDFFVINELAHAYYMKSHEFKPDRDERRSYLSQAIAAYRRTLAIDSEDVQAHYGLAQAYNDVAWGKLAAPTTPPPDGKDRSRPVAPDELPSFTAVLNDPKSSDASRREAAQQLADSVIRFMAGPRPQYQSRLEPLHDIVESLGPVWDKEVSPETRTALARALEVTHRRLHERLKPDETAEGEAFRIARQDDPAANQNAQSIVIHSLHRPGAPGIDRPGPKVALAAPTSAPIATENGR
jgi:tetratricopeptide (TPR) repeat protein